MANITTDTYLDDGTPRTAGETWTCNGGRLLIRTDTRWHVGAPASMTGSLGSVTVSSTLGGGYEIDATNVRWLAFNSGSGNVPAIGTTVSQGGVFGYLLGVWADLTSAPSAVGSPMPSSGYLKFREVTGGSFSAGALSGIGANATGSDVVGWIEVVHDQEANLTFPRLGSGFKTRGDWFELGITNGSAGQTFQVPTNGGGTDTHVPGVYIETGSGTGVFEWWPAMTTTTGWSTTYIGTDVRAKLVQSVGNGVVRIGSDGTNNVGYVPPAGCRVRIPNIIGRQCLTTSRNLNALPSTTLGTRPEFATTSAGLIDIQHFINDWYCNFVNAYSVNLSYMCTEGTIVVTNSPSPVNISNCCVGKIVTLDTYALNLQTNVNGGNISNNTILRTDATSHGYTVFLNNCAGTESNPFLLNGNKLYAGIGAERSSTGYAICLYNCSYIKTQNQKQLNHETFINICSNITINGIDHCDRVVGTTNTTTGIYAVYINSSKNVIVSDITFGLNNTIANVHPYAGVVCTLNNLGGIKIRNCGTKANPLPGGSSNYPGYFWVSGGNEVDIKVQRCYLSATRILPFTVPKTVKGVLVEHVYGTQSQAQTMMALNGTYRNLGATNTTNGQAAVYGTHWLDVFTSNTTGRVVLAFNEPTADTLPYITTSFGSGAGFTSTGQLTMPNVNDQIIIETPYFIKGHTSFQNVAPTITGTNTNNFIYEYQIDTGSGWNGSWKTLNGTNLSGETISPSTGFKLKYRITCVTASSANVLTYISINTNSTADAQANNLYPLDTAEASLEITGLADGTTIKVFNSDYSQVLDEKTLSGTTTYTYNYDWDSDTGNFNVNILIWKNDKKIIRIENLTLTDTSQSIPISQTDDLVYGTAATNATIDFLNKLIIMSNNTSYDVQGIYSLWKNEILNSTNAKYDFAFSSIGGNTISGATSIPFYTYLANGWRVRPYENDYTLNVVNGILLVDGGGDPFVDTVGDYTVRVNYQQPIQAITVSTPSVNDIADAVWEETISSHTTPGSFGEKVGKKLLDFIKFLALK